MNENIIVGTAVVVMILAVFAGYRAVMLQIRTSRRKRKVEKIKTNQRLRELETDRKCHQRRRCVWNKNAASDTKHISREAQG